MPDKLQVFYDGGCPICSREIGFYRGKTVAGAIEWVDITKQPEAAVAHGLTRKAALSRLHVRRPDGTLVSGAAAFAVIWQQIPSFRLLGRLVSLPPVTPLAELGYRGFLRLRKLWR